MSLDKSISFRIEESDKDRFIEKCDQVSTPPHTILREIVKAFTDGRLKVTPTPEQKKQMKEFYQ